MGELRCVLIAEVLDTMRKIVRVPLDNLSMAEACSQLNLTLYTLVLPVN